MMFDSDSTDSTLAGCVEPPSEPKFQNMGGQLYTVLPQETGRYDVHTRVKREEIVVDMSMLSSDHHNCPSLGQWKSTVHPEGDVYFYLENTTLRAVTHSNLHNVSVAERVNAWVEHVQILACHKGLDFANTEVFLKLDGNDCQYYLVDHSKQTVFWFQSDESDALGLSPVVSRSHMDLQLQAQYWAHVENFCNHIGGLKVECIDGLIQLFAHGFADHLTSPLSTFPFDAATTEKFLNLLTSSRDRINQGHTVAIVARLWGVIMCNRYENHHGQVQARLSRDQSILVDTVKEIQWTKTPLAVLTFGTAAAFNTRLDALFVDRVLYGREWEAFIKYCMAHWTQSSVASTVLIFIHIFSVFLPVSPSLAYVSATSAVLSILTALVLMHRHAELVDAEAVIVHEYLDEIISPYLKFQATAAVFALPKVFAIWALIALLAQWIVALAQFTDVRQAACVVALVCCVLLAVHLATSRTRSLNRTGGIGLRSCAKKAPCSMV